MAEMTIPLALVVSYEAATEEEEAVAFEQEHRDHNGWVVVRLNGSTEVARLRLGYVDWCDGEQVAALSQSGAEVMATGFFGTLTFRLDEPGSAEAIVRAFADMVENAKLDYDSAWMAGAPADDRNPLD